MQQQLQPVLWGLIVPFLDAQDFPAARLACSDVAAAIDANSTTAARKFRITCWDPAVLHSPKSLQHSLQHLEANISSARDWSRMQQFLQHLPQLHSLYCTGNTPDTSATTTAPCSYAFLGSCLI
jgi:hypothetical protein